MSSMVETAEKEMIRNEILKMCDTVGAQGASEQVIRAGLRKLGIQLSEENISKQVAYLEGKNLVSVERIDNARLGINRSIVKITSLGMDVLEGNAAASGISTD